MPKRYQVLLLALFVGLDLLFTFAQYCQLPIDGDLAAIVVPGAWYRPVLHDPFGWAVLSKNAVYAAPNRFFAHAAMVGYLRNVPRWLQVLASPIDSIYLAGALFSTGIHALLLALLAAYVRLRLPGAGSRGAWLTAALLTPLFQTAGFYGQMGIVSRSLTFTFFYAFPLALLLAWLLPFYRAACQQKPLQLPWPLAIAWVVLAVVLAFNGPVVAATVAVLLAVVVAQWAWERRPTGLAAAWAARPAWCSPQALGLGLALGVLCAYSLFIGRNNVENSHPFTLWQLYQRLPYGIFEELTSKLGLPLLLGFVLLNAQLLRRLVPPSAEAQRVRQLLRWVSVFAALYIALLPLGGYRPYRFYLLRNDSILPVLLGLLLAYGLSAVYLLGQLRGRARQWYMGGVLLLAGIFLNADRRLWLRDNNTCERQALGQLSWAAEPIVHLPADCTVMSWERVTDYQQSALNAELLYYWGVTPRRTLYYQ